MNRFFYVFQVNFTNNSDENFTISFEQSSLETALMMAKIQAASIAKGFDFTVSLSKSYNA
jgi:hypothetical protein